MSNIKICFKCGEYKKITDYYKHSKMKGGRLNKCKDCTRLDSKKNRELKLNDSDWVEREKMRCRDKYHRLNYKNKYKPTSNNKKATINKYINRYPEKYKAKCASNRMPKVDGMEKHHWSYNELYWKDIIYISTKNHNKIHRHMRYCEKTFMYKVSIAIDEFKEGVLLDTKAKHQQFINLVILN